MTVNIPTFCFEASLALLVALLAWGDQISQPREAVRNVVSKFLENFNEYRKDLVPILYNSVDKRTGAMKYSLSEFVESALTLIDSGKIGQKDRNVIEKLNKLKNKKANLELDYSSRYFLTIALDIWFAVAGFLSVYNGDQPFAKAQGFKVSFDVVYVSFIVLISLIILTNLIFTYLQERSFVRQTEELDELMLR